MSTIELVEQTAGITFPGIPDSMKSTWGDDFFFAEGFDMQDLKDAKALLDDLRYTRGPLDSKASRISERQVGPCQRKPGFS